MFKVVVKHGFPAKKRIEQSMNLEMSLHFARWSCFLVVGSGPEKHQDLIPMCVCILFAHILWFISFYWICTYFFLYYICIFIYIPTYIYMCIFIAVGSIWTHPPAQAYEKMMDDPEAITRGRSMGGAAIRAGRQRRHLRVEPLGDRCDPKVSIGKWV